MPENSGDLREARGKNATRAASSLTLCVIKRREGRECRTGSENRGKDVFVDRDRGIENCRGGELEKRGCSLGCWAIEAGSICRPLTLPQRAVPCENG